MHPGAALSDAIILAVGVVLVTIGIWVRHGGLTALTGGGWVEAWESVAQVTGLLTSTVALIAIAVASRTHRFERAVGLDHALLWHRWLAESAALLLVAHIASSVVAWSSREGFAEAIGELIGEEQYMAMATVGAAGMLLITFLSLGFVRRRLSYESWYFIHLTLPSTRWRAPSGSPCTSRSC
jgi:predicted ferric reductase